MAPKPSANIVAFGRGVIPKYAKNFDSQLSKGEAVDLEHKDHVGKTLCTENFGEVRLVQPRELGEELYNIYNLGHGRRMAYYPDFGIYKFVLWGMHGDFEHNVKHNYS
jgi:hypothetical protein